MPNQDPGPSIKKPKTYEALKSEGYSKAKAAAISNAQFNKEHPKQKSKRKAKKKTRKAPATKQS